MLKHNTLLICQSQKHCGRSNLNLIIIIVCHSQWPHDSTAPNSTFPSAPILSQSPGPQELGDTGRGGKSLLPPVFRHLHCKYNHPNPPIQPVEGDGRLQGCWAHLPPWTAQGIQRCEPSSRWVLGHQPWQRKVARCPLEPLRTRSLLGKGVAFAMWLCHALVCRSKSVWGISVSVWRWNNGNSTAWPQLLPLSPCLPPFT